MKRIMTIQDISCLGKCSITAALPTLSAMGVETVILPTAVLSTHTMFPGYTCKNLQDQILPITGHWKKLGFTFDAIYTGYLAAAEQIDLVKQVFRDFDRPAVLRFVDPAMADNGRLYAGFDPSFPQAMAALCAQADIILPNLTEACLMTDTPYCDTIDKMDLQRLLDRLAGLGTRQAVVITGATGEAGMTGFSGLDVRSGRYFRFAHDKIAASYHGTGDLFASTALGALMQGKSLEDALQLAAKFVSACIRETAEHDPGKTYGVDFEAVLPRLITGAL